MQNLLFKDLPVRRENKKQTKNLIDKSKTQEKRVSVRSSNDKTHIQLIIDTARQLLSNEDTSQLTYAHNVDEFVNYCDVIIKNGICTLDTETDGLDPTSLQIASMSLYTPGQKAIHIPINQVNLDDTPIKENLPQNIVTEQLNRLLDAQVKFIFHNADYDVRVNRWTLSVRIKPYWDTELAANLLNENESHVLKDLWGKYCNNGQPATHFSTLFEKVKFKYIPLELAYIYGAKDALMTWQLYEFQKKYLDTDKLKRVKEVLEKIEMPLVPVVADMEDNGCKIDVKFAKELTDKYNAEAEEMEKDIYAEIAKFQDKINALPDALRSKLSNPIKLSSPTQLAILIYDVLKLKSSDREKPRGTGAEILANFKLPIFKKILDYRGCKKLVSTYTDKLPNCINPKTGHIHGLFNQYGAATGRFSSSDPNLQNIPSHNKSIRKMFIADEGYVLVGGDFSQQEPKVLAHMSGDETLINAYLTGKDLYATVASMVYKLPYEECLEFYLDENGHKTDKVNPEGKKRRSNIKSVVLGIMYDRGAASIAEQTGATLDEAQGIITQFFTMFPKVKKFVDETKAHAKKYGFVETAYGRKRRLPDIMLPQYTFEGDVPDNVKLNYLNRLKHCYGSKATRQVITEARNMGIKIYNNGGKIAKAERECVNSIIQGSSADITKKALIDIGNDALMKSYGFKLMLTIHDEIIGECRYKNRHECAKRLSELMINSCTDTIKVPMKVDTEITYRWYGEEVE